MTEIDDSKIDYSKASEGATHYNPKGTSAIWYKRSIGGWVYHYGGSSWSWITSVWGTEEGYEKLKPIPPSTTIPKFSVKNVIIYNDGSSYTTKQKLVLEQLWYLNTYLLAGNDFKHLSSIYLKGKGSPVLTKSIALIQEYKEDGSVINHFNHNVEVYKRKLPKVRKPKKVATKYPLLLALENTRKTWRKYLMEESYELVECPKDLGGMVILKVPSSLADSTQDTQHPVKDEDGFIIWNGGEMPVPKGTMVHVRYRNGGESIVTAGLSYGEEGYKRVSGSLTAINWSGLYLTGITAYKLYEEPAKIEQVSKDQYKVRFPPFPQIHPSPFGDYFKLSYEQALDNKVEEIGNKVYERVLEALSKGEV